MAKRKQNQVPKRMIGRYIVTDPAVCHGQPTFRGTRILVADVMEQVAGGIAWEVIVEEWRGDVSPDAIAEAIRLASQAFCDHSAQYTALEYVPERSRDGVLFKPVQERPSMVKVDGLWVHQGSAEPRDNWLGILDDVREERFESVLKS